MKGVDLLYDLSRSLDFIPSISANEILAYDVLEHFPFGKVPKILNDWVRILNIDGKIVIRVPDMRFIAKRLLSGELPAFEVQRLLFGGQENDHDFHCMGFTGDFLEALLIGCGCSKIIQRVQGENEDPPSHNVTLVAVK